MLMRKYRVYGLRYEVVVFISFLSVRPPRIRIGILLVNIVVMKSVIWTLSHFYGYAVSYWGVFSSRNNILKEQKEVLLKVIFQM